MKIRNGFVSNSSTSSFIVIGCCTEDITSLKGLDYEQIEEKIEALNKEHGTQIQLCSDEGDYYIGTHFYISDEEGFGPLFSFEDVLEDVEQIKKVFKDDNVEIFVHGGIVAS